MKNFIEKFVLTEEAVTGEELEKGVNIIFHEYGEELCLKILIEEISEVLEVMSVHPAESITTEGRYNLIEEISDVKLFAAIAHQRVHRKPNVIPKGEAKDLESVQQLLYYAARAIYFLSKYTRIRGIRNIGSALGYIDRFVDGVAALYNIPNSDIDKGVTVKAARALDRCIEGGIH